MTTNVGLTLTQAAKRGFMRRFRDIFLKPEAASVTKVVASVDPNGVAAGTALTLQTNVSLKKLRYARKVTLVITDNSFSAPTPLTVAVLLTGTRFGAVISETINAVSTSGAAFTATSTKVYDQILSAVLVSKANAAAADALSMGIDGTCLGLERPIGAVADVKSAFKLLAGVEQAPIALSSTTIDAANSALIGLTILATDDYEVEYDFGGADGIGPGGVEA